ncbi:hypothetical protein K7432_013175 [Basidiobolus ranarum]|uniref:ABC transmembrane type-1 domain-containing protein n=1 Tax=Basidiobolus ranarum TaxID=34480 RepID=A0ABR2VS58_9FUNG
MSKEEAFEDLSAHNNENLVAISVSNEKDLGVSIDDIDDDKKKDKKMKDAKKPGLKVSYFKLYRFASSWDITCIILGTICAIGCGVGQPLVAQLMGDVINGITGPVNPDTIKDQVATLREIVIKFTIIGAIILFAAYGQMCFFTLSAENQTKRIREKYLHAIMRQDIAWHDIGKKSESLNSRLNSDTQLIFDGMSDKVGMCIMSLSTFITGFVIAFLAGWKMTLVLLTAVPVMGFCGALMAKYTMASSSAGQDSYAKAGGLAEQAISSIRTVVAFNGQGREVKRFEDVLATAYKAGVKKAFVTGAGMGSFMFVMFCAYALAFWYGGRLVKEGEMESGNVLTS